MGVGGLYMLSRQNWKAIIHAFLNPQVVLPEKRANEKDWKGTQKNDKEWKGMIIFFNENE